MNYHNPQLADLLAAEYVLGTLKGRARQRFDGLLHASPSLRQRVQEWELRLNSLAQDVPPVAPPQAAWENLQIRLFPSPKPSTPAPRANRFERLAFWRGLTLGSAVLASILAALLVVKPFTQDATGYVVLLNDKQQYETTWTISAPTDLEQLYVKNMKPIQLPKDIRCVLWVQPEGSSELYPLGVLPDKGDTMKLQIDKNMRPKLPGQLLVTRENLSGPMPTKPSGPAKYEGKWMRIPVEAF
jgi:anti-sigma-K factor RskA